MSIVINPPTSNIDRALAARLLDTGKHVTVMSRDKTKVDALHGRGARVVEGSFEEPGLLAEPLEGAEALFGLTPARPDYHTWASGPPWLGGHDRCSSQIEIRARTPITANF